MRRGFPYPVTLLFSARTDEDVFDEGLMAWWAKRHRKFEFTRTLTREDGEGPTGRITKILPELFPDLSGHSVFIAGSPDFVEDVKDVVEYLGGEESLIHTEGYYPAMEPEYPPAERLV